MGSAPLDRRVDRLEEAMAELARAQAQTQIELATLSSEMREFKNEVRRALGGLTNQLGRLVEDIIGPSIPATFAELFGVSQDLTHGIRLHRPHRTRSGQEREFDAVAAGGDVFLAVQVKAKLAPEAVAEFARQLPEARDYFPEWTQGRRVIGAVAAFHVDPSLVKGAERLGLYVFGLDRSLIDVLNSPDFQPISV